MIGINNIPSIISTVFLFIRGTDSVEKGDFLLEFVCEFVGSRQPPKVLTANTARTRHVTSLCGGSACESKPFAPLGQDYFNIFLCLTPYAGYPYMHESEDESLGQQ